MSEDLINKGLSSGIDPSLLPNELKQKALILDLKLQSHAGTALVVTSKLEQTLRLLLEIHLPNGSKKLNQGLFDGLGPLSALSSKINLAFAIGAITANDHKALHAIREIRNAFAHARDPLHFGDEVITKLARKLPLYKPALDEYNGITFMLSANSVLESMAATITAKFQEHKAAGIPAPYLSTAAKPATKK